MPSVSFDLDHRIKFGQRGPLANCDPSTTCFIYTSSTCMCQNRNTKKQTPAKFVKNTNKHKSTHKQLSIYCFIVAFITICRKMEGASHFVSVAFIVKLVSKHENCVVAFLHLLPGEKLPSLSDLGDGVRFAFSWPTSGPKCK